MGKMNELEIKMSNGDAYECVLCNGIFEGYGNNPDPCVKSGRCCDDCNTNKVIPQRMNDTIFLQRRRQQISDMRNDLFRNSTPEERQAYLHYLRQMSHEWFINNS
jgi:hypothetical protein